MLNLKIPDDPELVVPVKNITVPLAPAFPAFLLLTTTDPDEQTLDIPVCRDKMPPVADGVSPELA